MRHVAAYLLCVLGGKANPSADDIKKVITSIEGEADDAQIAALLEAVKGKTADEVLAAGKEKLSTIKVGGGGGEEEKKEEEEEEEEIDMGGGADMFGGGDEDY